MARKRKGERSDGRIQISLDVGYDSSGKRIRKYFYGKTRIEAERKKAAFLSRGSYRPDISVSEWVDVYLKTYRTGVNPLYLAQDNVPYNRIKSEIGERPMASVREIDLQALLNKTAGMSFSFITKYSQAIKRVFKKARKNGVIADDPSEDLKLPAYTKGSHRALTRGEVELVLKCWGYCYSGLWVLLMLFCGLRRGEMMALDWSSVDLSARTLTVRQTAVIDKNRAVIENRAKSKAGLRIIPIPDFIYSALLSVPHRSGFVCLSAQGKPLTECSASLGLKKFNSVVNRYLAGEPLSQPGRRSDLSPESSAFQVRFHDLRHTYATLLFDAGVDVKTAAYLLGHSDVSVTMKIYTHLSEQKKAASSELMLGYFRSLVPQNSLEKNAEMPEK